MAERAAHLLDHVFPDVPVRQWVLSLPYRLRYQLAWDHDLCRAVVGVLLRAVLGFLRARARGGGVDDGRGGAVAVIQRFGGALNLNLHIHALVLDGVFARTRAGVLTFHPTRRLTALDVDEVLATRHDSISNVMAPMGVTSGSGRTERSGGRKCPSCMEFRMKLSRGTAQPDGRMRTGLAGEAFEPADDA
jgi:hypothetical protein